MSNVNGFCPHCKADFDDNLIYDTFINQGKTKEEAIKCAKYYEGWEQYGPANRWSRAIGISSLELDRTTGYMCPDCHKEFKTILRISNEN
jgi:DNA-directed RNA polymerase subunit RPC12/RpoP